MLDEVDGNRSDIFKSFVLAEVPSASFDDKLALLAIGCEGLV